MLIAQLLNVEEAYQLALQVEKKGGLSSGKWPTPMKILKPLLSNDQTRNVVMGDQKGKGKLTTEGPHVTCAKDLGITLWYALQGIKS